MATAVEEEEDDDEEEEGGRPDCTGHTDPAVPSPSFSFPLKLATPPLQKHQEVLAQLQQHCPCLFSEAEVGEREEAGRKDWENQATRKDEH